MRKSDIIKLELMKYYRFKRAFWFVCSEGIHNADINAVKEKCLIEVEIKISKSDFRREFQTFSENKDNYWKEQKHRIYAEPSGAWSSYTVPNQFYFCVPKEMAPWSLEYLNNNGKNPKYGLISFDAEAKEPISFVRGAKDLHPNPPKKNVFKLIGQRTASELINLKDRYNKNIRELEATKKGILYAEGIA